jgi:hypothetical protein
MIRTDAQLSVSRLAELIGVPRRTYHYPSPAIGPVTRSGSGRRRCWNASNRPWRSTRNHGRPGDTARCGLWPEPMATTSVPKHLWPGRCAAGACCSR